MPQTIEDAKNVAAAIRNGHMGSHGSACSWPIERIRAGMWTPVQWYDLELAEIILKLESSTLLESIGSRYDMGPVGQAIRGTFKRYKECRFCPEYGGWLVFSLECCPQPVSDNDFVKNMVDRGLIML